MAKKYIIVDRQGSLELIASSAIDFHYQLIPKSLTKEDVRGGGWWDYNKERHELTLFGLSSDFGVARKEDILECFQNDNIHRSWRGCVVYHTPFNFGIKIEDPKVLLNRTILIF